MNYKKNAEKIIQNKDGKIKQLQQIVNQSFNSLNHGMDNIQLAKKLDDEVQQLIQNVKKISKMIYKNSHNFFLKSNIMNIAGFYMVYSIFSL